MARDLGSKCKKCRREGRKLLLKGERCYGVKCAMIKRAYPPGQHGQAKRMSVSEYNSQLREKQKVKRTYGILERQFKKYYEMALKMKGSSMSLLSGLLERRLDNVIYRLGIGSSRNQSRQLVSHKHILVNGKSVNIPSYLVKEGDIISVRNPKLKYFQELKSNLKNYQIPSWLALNYDKIEGKVVSLPTNQEIDSNFDFQLVIEHYSKS